MSDDATPPDDERGRRIPASRPGAVAIGTVAFEDDDGTRLAIPGGGVPRDERAGDEGWYVRLDDGRHVQLNVTVLLGRKPYIKWAASEHDLLMVDIRGLINGPRLSTLTVATWLKTETVGGAEAGYAPEHLESQRIYTGVLRFTFQVIE